MGIGIGYCMGIGIGIRIASAQCNFVVLATKNGQKKMCRERRRERKPSQRRAVNAIDMLDRQRRDKDGQADAHIQIRALGEPGVGFGFDSADSTARIRLSKPIVGPCKCQACVSFHMPAASRSTLLSLSHSLFPFHSSPPFRARPLSVCFMRYELHKFPGSVFMDLFLFIIMLCVWCVYECVCMCVPVSL